MALDKIQMVAMIFSIGIFAFIIELVRHRLRHTFAHGNVSGAGHIFTLQLKHRATEQQTEMQ